MKKQAKVLLSVATAMVIIFCILFCVILVANKKSSSYYIGTREIQDTNKIDSVNLMSEEKVDIVTSDGSNYVIIFSSDSRQTDQALATELSKEIRQGCGVNIRYMPDSVTAETEYEIIIGDTNRAFSTELLETINAHGSADEFLVWGYAYKDGKLAYTANSDIAFSYGANEFLSLLSKDGTLRVPEGLWVINSITVAEYEEEIEAEKEAEKQNRIEDLKKEIASFSDSLFGERTTMDTEFYENPHTYPTKGQHPRLNLTADMLPEIKAILENPDYKELSGDFWTLANSDEDGIRPNVSTLGKRYNWDGEVLARIEAKALAYLITGDVEYGYQAILATKNHMLTLTLHHDAFADIFRAYGWAMMVTGEVYDWCYDLMTETDKSQFVRGVQKYYCEDCYCGEHEKMTIGFPPINMSAIAGHGSSFQMTRDYVSFAIAIFDEYPDWWELIGGRFYEEYVPAFNVFYSSSLIPQGTSCYAPLKLYAQLYGAWLIKVMSGEMPYDSAVESTVYGFMGLRLPNGKMFNSGDGTKFNDGSTDDLRSVLYIAQALFPSEIIQRNTRVLTDNYRAYAYYVSANFITPSTSLIFRSNGYNEEPAGDDKCEDLELVYYYGSPMGLMTVRDSWNEDASVVYMKIGELTNNNHDNEDAGTFQIYYKGCFTTESGLYSGDTGAPYGGTHHKYWHQATISKNGLLVYNPDLSTTEDGWYSGGQLLVEANRFNDVEGWLAHEDAIIGKVTGRDYYYGSDENVQYAYIAGNITDAYSRETVEDIERRMLTVYTGNSDFPMIFAIYDYVNSVSSGFTKSFLFHTTTEPIIDGNTAFFEQGEGRIVLNTLTNGAEIKSYGGPGKTYWINDVVGNCDKPDSMHGNIFVGDRIADGDFWGRVQVDNVGNKEDHLLNIFYVTDAGNENFLTPIKIADNDDIICAITDRTITAFVKGLSKCKKILQIETKGIGFYNYYVSGLSAGSWTVKVDGVTVAHTHTSEESGLIDFVAPAGVVTIEPGSDVRPENSDDISYVTYGGMLPDDAPLYYIYDDEVILPVIEDTSTTRFVGWTLDPYSTDYITSIPVGTRGRLKLYAKYLKKYVQDFEKIQIPENATKTFASDGYSFILNNKIGASFNAVTAEGNRYLLWKAGIKDPEILLNGSLKDYISPDNIVTFSVDVALNGDAPALKSRLRLRAQPTPTAASNLYCSNLFNFDADGAVRLGDSAIKLTKLSMDFTTLTVSLDTKSGILYAFDNDGNFLAKTELTLSKDSKVFTYSEYVSYCSTYIIDWYSSPIEGNGELRIDNIIVSGGFPEGAVLPDESAPNAIVYRGVGIMPFGTRYYYNPKETTPLPVLADETGKEFYGWYSDSNFESPIYEIPAGQTGPFYVYARWKSEWIEDFNEIIVNAYTNEDGTEYQNDTDNGVNYNANKNNSTVIKTVLDENGGQYLYWSSKKYANMQPTGKLVNFIGDDTSATFRMKLATDNDTASSQIVVRLQGASSSVTFILFQTNAQGQILLNNNKKFVIGNLSNTFTEIIVSVDFANATLTAYNTDGSVIITENGTQAIITNLAIPKGSTAESFLDFKNEISSGFVFLNAYADTEKETALRVDDIIINSGSYVMKKFTADATDIVYDGLGSANLPFGSPMNYDRELGTDLPQNVESGTELEIFAGWFLDKEFTKPITRIKAGTLGAIKVYAKWISYTEAQNAIIYNGIELNELPEGTNYYHSPMDKTSLPLIADKNGMEFCGWYTESTFQNQIYEVPAGCTSQFNVYARWKTEWIEDFDDVTVDAYTNADGTDYKNDSDNGINYYANKNFSTVIKTVDDGNGGQYLFWSSKKYANMQAIGNLTNFIGDDTSATFRIKLATVDDKVPSQIVVRLQGASSNITFVLFQTNVQGKILLNNNKNFVIGTLSNEFTEFIVTVDFFNATLTAYNTDGSVVITESGVPAIITDLAIPKGSTAESFLDFRNEISSGFVFMNAYADTVNDTALRVDDIIINSGYYNMKSCNKETGEG